MEKDGKKDEMDEEKEERKRIEKWLLFERVVK